MREDLLGYLLGALEPHEMRRVEQLLRDDPVAREELAAIEQLLRPLEQTPLEEEPPPAGLIERTLAQLPPVEAPLPSATGATEPFESAVAGSTFASGRDLVSPLPSFRRGVEPPARPNRRWVDWAAGSLAAVVLLSLLLPALAEGRFAARRTACQDHLREFGTAITQFVMLNQQQRLPPLAESGPHAFAGMWAIRLFEAGLLSQPELRWCPSRGPRERPDLRLEFLIEDDLAELNRLVASDFLHELSPDDLARSQQYAGGDYAYQLGAVQNGQYVTPRYEGRSGFALMSDAPTGWFIDGTQLQQFIGHDGRGINILYEDGSVRFVPVDSLWSMPDHPLFNDRGDVEAGVEPDDAVLGASWRGPFLDAPQR